MQRELYKIAAACTYVLSYGIFITDPEMSYAMLRLLEGHDAFIV
jgi:hypothetical protein